MEEGHKFFHEYQTDRSNMGRSRCLSGKPLVNHKSDVVLITIFERKKDEFCTRHPRASETPYCQHRKKHLAKMHAPLPKKKKTPDLPWPTVDCQSGWTAGEEQHTRLLTVDNGTHRRCLLPRSPRAAHWQSDQKTRFRIWKQHCSIRMFSNPLHSRK